MGFFRKKKKKAVIVERTPSQKLNDEIKTHARTVNNLERLKPRLNKFIVHYKKQLDSDSGHIYDGGITLTFNKGFKGYPDGFFAFTDKLGLNIEPLCASRYDYKEEKTFVVRAKAK